MRRPGPEGLAEAAPGWWRIPASRCWEVSQGRLSGVWEFSSLPNMRWRWLWPLFCRPGSPLGVPAVEARRLACILARSHAWREAGARAAWRSCPTRGGGGEAAFLSGFAFLPTVSPAGQRRVLPPPGGWGGGRGNAERRRRGPRCRRGAVGRDRPGAAPSWPPGPRRPASSTWTWASWATSTAGRRRWRGRWAPPAPPPPSTGRRRAGRGASRWTWASPACAPPSRRSWARGPASSSSRWSTARGTPPSSAPSSAVRGGGGSGGGHPCPAPVSERPPPGCWGAAAGPSRPVPVPRGAPALGEVPASRREASGAAPARLSLSVLGASPGLVGAPGSAAAWPCPPSG